MRVGTWRNSLNKNVEGGGSGGAEEGGRLQRSVVGGCSTCKALQEGGKKKKGYGWLKKEKKINPT